MPPISILELTGNVNIVTRAVINHKGKYLVVQEGKESCYGKWAFVGGKLDSGEFLSQAITREIEEETGITATPQGLIGVRHRLWEKSNGFTLEFYFVTTADSIPDSFPMSAEIIGTAWKSVEELEEMSKAKEFRNSSQEIIITYLRNGIIFPMSQLIESVTENPNDSKVG